MIDTKRLLGNQNRQVFFLSFIILMILAWLSVGWYHPDEHFQILEFAAWKLHIARPDDLAWEFHCRMRPAIQPAIVVAIHKIFDLLGCRNPFTITFILRIFTAALSFFSMLMVYKRYAKEISVEMVKKWFLLLSFLLWFELYNGVRFCSETWSGSLFIIGFSYLFVIQRKLLKSDYFITGLILGLSFIFRYQSGFLIAGFLAWFAFIQKERFIHLSLMFSGIILLISMGILIDRWFYEEWTLTIWNYFQQNILADKISGFGIEPWWFYFTDIFNRAVPPFSLVYIGAILIVIFFLRKDILTWTLLPFILIHFVIGHKESRFFYPIIGFLPILIIKAIQFIGERKGGWLLENKIFLVSAKIFWYVNLLLIITVFFNPADEQANLYKAVYNQYPEPITIYYFKENPYHRAKDISYYKRENLVIKQSDSMHNSLSKTGTKYLMAVRSKDEGAELFKNEKLIYCSYPEWIKSFNFNHWMERTNFWYIYEISGR